MVWECGCAEKTAQYCQSAVQQYLAAPQKSGGLGGLFGKK